MYRKIEIYSGSTSVLYSNRFLHHYPKQQWPISRSTLRALFKVFTECFRGNVFRKISGNICEKKEIKDVPFGYSLGYSKYQNRRKSLTELVDEHYSHFLH